MWGKKVSRFFCHKY